MPLAALKMETILADQDVSCPVLDRFREVGPAVRTAAFLPEKGRSDNGFSHQDRVHELQMEDFAFARGRIRQPQYRRKGGACLSLLGHKIQYFSIFDST